MLDWLKIIPGQALQRWQKLPFLGRSPHFDWNALRAQLQQRSGFAEFKVEESSLQWHTDPLKGFADNCASIGLAGFQGRVLSAISNEHLELLFGWLIGDHALADTSLREAFWRFFLLQTLDVVHGVEPLTKIGLSILSISDRDRPESTDESALCYDVTIARGEQSLVMRLIFDSEFIQGWKLHWQAKESPKVDLKAAKEISLPLQLIADQITLLPKELQSLKVGDFVRLESGNLEQKSGVSLRVSGVEIGKGELKDKMITVQECSPSPFAAAQVTDQE